MLFATIDNIPDKKYEVLGVVHGWQQFKKLTGAVKVSHLETMEINAKNEFGNSVDAIIGIKMMYETNGEGRTVRIFCYGTAIKFLD